jgi:dihydropteroate synthase
MMCEAGETSTPSAKLATQAAEALLKADIVREKDLEELQSALSIGRATAGQWLLWVDLATEEDDGDE